ncbi:MAG: hypothetical protein E6I48_07790 [Chloroflexi bacterium]|nr:MAG: hypothetical protein E6I48_07790 [Chloroflexota bacterium]
MATPGWLEREQLIASQAECFRLAEAQERIERERPTWGPEWNAWRPPAGALGPWPEFVWPMDGWSPVSSPAGWWLVPVAVETEKRRRAHDDAAPPVGQLTAPARLAEVPVADVPALLTQLAALQTALAAQLAQAPSSNGNGEGDRLLSLEDAAKRLSILPDWLRRQKTLPFRVELSPGQVRYSARGIEQFIARRVGK